MKRRNARASSLRVLECTIARCASTGLLLVGVQVWTPSLAYSQQRHMAGEVLVTYALEVSNREIAAMNRLHGMRILEVIPKLGIYRPSIPGNATVGATIAQLREDPRCEDVRPNYTGEGNRFWDRITSPHSRSLPDTRRGPRDLGSDGRRPSRSTRGGQPREGRLLWTPTREPERSTRLGGDLLLRKSSARSRRRMRQHGRCGYFFRSTTHSQCESPRTMFLVSLKVKSGFRLSVAPSPQL